MDAIEERRIGNNLVISTHYDPDPMSPREWDNLTTIRGWHRHYVVGDGPDIDPSAYESWDDMIQSVMDEDGPLVLLAPLYWYEHSGSSCKMGEPISLDSETKSYDPADLAYFRSLCMDGAGWDSGVAGIVYVTAKCQANCGTPDELLAEAARGEVETYDEWMRGAVYGYTVTIESECDHGDTHADVLDSCWGFIGEDDYAMEQGMSFVGWQITSVLASIVR